MKYVLKMYENYVLSKSIVYSSGTIYPNEVSKEVYDTVPIPSKLENGVYVAINKSEIPDEAYPPSPVPPPPSDIEMLKEQQEKMALEMEKLDYLAEIQSGGV